MTNSYHMEELATFDEKTFALVLLPIIIFDAGFGARKRRFFGNLGPIMVTVAVGETVILLRAPLPSVGVSIVMERGFQPSGPPSSAGS